MIAIVIPAYNEEKNIEWIVNESKKYGKVIVVDDSSKDQTSELAKKAGALVIKHEKNGGLGTSLRSGFEKALEMRADIIVTIDADGQHDPEEIPKLIDAVYYGYDFVLGERDLSKYPFKKKFGNFFLNWMTNFVSCTNLSDTESGFRAFRGEALKKLMLKAKRYEIAVEIIFEVGRNKLRATNVPIKSPIYIKGKGVSVLDGIKNFRYLLSRRKRNFKSYFDDMYYVLRNKI